MRTRPGRSTDGDHLRQLWSATFPQLPAADPITGAATGEVLIGEQGSEDDAEVVAAALISSVREEPLVRRLQVLAAGHERWTGMHEAAVGHLRGAGVRRWYVVVREDSGAVLDRLVSAGYTVHTRSWGASLDVDDDVLARLAALSRTVTPHVRLRRLDAEDAGAAHDLFTAFRADFPVTPATTPADLTAAQMADLITTGHAYGAWAEQKLLALTVMRTDAHDAADTEFTVTARAARRRGLATALKAHAVHDVATTTGVRHFRTGGAQVNEPSLRANRRLGYQVEPLWLSLTSPDDQR